MFTVKCPECHKEFSLFRFKLAKYCCPHCDSSLRWVLKNKTLYVAYFFVVLTSLQVFPGKELIVGSVAILVIPWLIFYSGEVKHL